MLALVLVFNGFRDDDDDDDGDGCDKIGNFMMPA